MTPFAGARPCDRRQPREYSHSAHGMSASPAQRTGQDAEGEEFQPFERGLREVLPVSKSDLDAEAGPEKRDRANGDGRSQDAEERSVEGEGAPRSTPD